MKFSHGDYAMHHMGNGQHGMLVRVLKTDQLDRFGCGYVTDSGEDGGSSWSWPESEFRPITDPIKLAAAMVNKARHAVADTKANLAAAEADLRIRVLALEYMQQIR